MASTGGLLVPLAGEPAVLDERPPSPAGLLAPNVPRSTRLRAPDAGRLAGPRNRSGWRPLGRRPLCRGQDRVHRREHRMVENAADSERTVVIPAFLWGPV